MVYRHLAHLVREVGVARAGVLISNVKQLADVVTLQQ